MLSRWTGVTIERWKEEQAEREMRGMVGNKAMQQEQSGEPVLRKGPWMPEEDEVLLEYVRQYGPRDWSSIRSKGLLPRTGKSCRLRWVNKLKPDLKSGCKFSPEEERTVVKMQSKLGNKWAKIASYLPGRTDNDVKNFWSTRQKRILRALQRPKLAAGSGEGVPAASSSSEGPMYMSKDASELTAFQVPSSMVPSNYEPAFYFGEEDQHSFVRPESCKMEPDLHGFDSSELQEIAPSAAEALFSDTSFSLTDDLTKSSGYQTFSGPFAKPVSKKRSKVRRAKEQDHQELGHDGNIAMQIVAHHAPLRTNDCIFGVNFFPDGTELDFLLQPETGAVAQSQQLLVQEFPVPALAQQWEKLPLLYSETDSATSFSEAKASNKTGVVDSCSPDSVLAALPGDVFDCLEPLCPAPAEWWVTKTG